MVEMINGVTLYTKEEFAQIIRASISTINRWINEGKLTYWQIGNSKQIRIPASELTRHLHPK